MDEITRDEIRAVFLRNGFTVKPGETDLKPYVYAAAEELVTLARKPDPTEARDKPYEVVLDSRDLWDALRAAHREGQSCGELDAVDSWSVSSTYANSAIVGWRTLRRVPADYIGSAVRWAVSELLGVLPVKRDWLNPDVERVLRDSVGVPIGRANK